MKNVIVWIALVTIFIISLIIAIVPICQPWRTILLGINALLTFILGVIRIREKPYVEKETLIFP